MLLGQRENILLFRDHPRKTTPLSVDPRLQAGNLIPSPLRCCFSRYTFARRITTAPINLPAWKQRACACARARLMKSALDKTGRDNKGGDGWVGGPCKSRCKKRDCRDYSLASSINPFLRADAFPGIVSKKKYIYICVCTYTFFLSAERTQSVSREPEDAAGTERLVFAVFVAVFTINVDINTDHFCSKCYRRADNNFIDTANHSAPVGS